jgi:hypothetical protein
LIGTPRIILGRGGFFKADDGRKHTKDEQENPHGKLQISGSQTQMAIQVFIPAFATRRGFCGEYRQPKFLEWCLTRLDGAGSDTPWYIVLGTHDAPAPVAVAKHC